MNRNYIIFKIILPILLILLLGVILYNIEKKNKISIVIPCIPRDIKYLDRLMESIKNQSYKPYEIIIALSGSNSTLDINKLNNSLIEKFNLPIKFSYTKKMCNASTNRNRGGKMCSGDIITFMDADDVMYPDKLLYINTYFNKYNPKILLHAYSKGYDNFEITKEFDIIFGKRLYDVATIVKKRKFLMLPIGNIHHGQPSISSDVFNNINFNENMEYAEDCLFLHDILNFYGRKDDTAIFIDIPLTQYLKHDDQQ